MKDIKKILATFGMAPSFKGYGTILRAVEIYPTCNTMSQVYNRLDTEIGNNKGCAERRIRYVIGKIFENKNNPSINNFINTYGEKPNNKDFISILCSMIND